MDSALGFHFIYLLHRYCQLWFKITQPRLGISFRANILTTKSETGKTFWAPAGFESIEKSVTLSHTQHCLASLE